MRLSSLLPFALLVSCGSSSGGSDGAVDAAGDATADVVTVCDEFTEVGAPCSLASPLVCFPMCEAGGCSCRPTASGPRWACTTDLSCVPDCAPIDETCGAGGAEEDAASADGPARAADAGPG